MTAGTSRTAHPIRWAGGLYSGELQNDEPWGQGSFTNPDGYKYVGEFKDGEPSGRGILTLPGGYKYQGEFSIMENQTARVRPH